MKNNNKKGFTLTELVVVIAIIAILLAVLIPLLFTYIDKARISNDNQLVRNLNTALTTDALENGKHKNMTEALEAAGKFGYDVSKINASKTDNEILWDSKNDVFCYLNDKKIEYIPASVNDSNKINTDDDVTKNEEHMLWVISTDSTLAGNTDNKYSVYYTGANADSVSVKNVGFDAGTAQIGSISYTGNKGHDVVIRTNSANTTLTIDDASTGTIYHYGSAGALNIIQCHTASYHEKGNVAFAEIAKGRIVLESGSEIKHIHVNANENANGFEEVIIADNGAKALPEAITRDQVDVSEAKPVVTVESGSASETVYVYPYTDAQEAKTGTTEQTTTQNTAIATDLGKLVLDNGSDAGEKAMSNNEKTSAKQEVVEVAQNEEEIEKAENAGYEITHHEALAPTCTEDGHTAYDSYYVNNEEQKVGYKVIEALGHDVNPETGICNRCAAQVYVFKVGTSLYKSNEFSTAWAAAKNSNKDFKILSNLTMNALPVDGKFSIDLNGYTLTLKGHSSTNGAVRVYGLTDKGGDLTIKNGTLNLTGANYSNYGIYSEGNLTVENVTINSACKTTVYVDGLLWNSVGSANLTNVVINATHASGTAYNAHSVSYGTTIYSPVSNLTNVTITSANDAVTINATNANLHSCNITASGRAAWIIFSATGNTIGTMTIDGETTLNAGSAYNRLNAQDGNTISILAGTYNFDPTAYVDDSAFNIVENDGAYIVSAK